MLSTKYLVLILIVFFVYIAWINYEKGPPEITGTSMREYLIMDTDQQVLTILEARRTLFHNYLNKNRVTHADCVARLFDAKTKQGRSQLNNIKAHLEAESARNDKELIIEEITINFITTNFCPK